MSLLTRPKKTVATIVVSQTGDGDTTDIQTGIDLLPATGGVVYIKEGTYNITEQITINKNNVELIGAGRATILSSNVTINIINFGDYDSIVVQDLQIRGDKTTGNVGIRAGASAQSFVTGCFITSCGGNGIRLPGASTQLNLLNNEIYDCGANGISMAVGSTIMIIGNRIRGNDEHGIAISTCTDSIVIGNQILTNGDSVLFDGIFLEGSSDRNIFSNNIISTSGNYGINISAATCDENLITGNIFNNNTTGAVNDLGTNTHPNGASGTTNLALDDLNIIA